MKRIFIALLVASALAGCTEEAPTHQDDCSDAENHEECHAAEREAMENETVEPAVFEITVSLTGSYLPGPGNTIGYSADPITVPANTTIRLTFQNTDESPTQPNHDFVVDGIEGAATSVIGVGEEETIEFFSGDAGATKFFCSVPGHRGNGMEGDFIVE